LRLRELGGRTLVDTKSLIGADRHRKDWTPKNRGQEARAKRKEIARAAFQGWSTAGVANSQGARVYISRRATSSIVGPGLSAIRASCDLWAENTAAWRRRSSASDNSLTLRFASPA